MTVEINPDVINGIYQQMKEYSNKSVTVGFIVGKKEDDNHIVQYVWIPPQIDSNQKSNTLEEIISNMKACSKSPVGVVQYNPNMKKFLPSANAVLYKNALVNRGYPNLSLIINQDGKCKICYE